MSSSAAAEQARLGGSGCAGNEAVSGTLNSAVLQQEAIALRDSFRSVQFATVSAAGVPDASYAPYVLDDQGAICVFVSALAQHTRNLLTVPRVSLLWIADERASSNLFARRRLRLECDVLEVPRDSTEWQRILQRLQAEHGETVATLRELPDFHLFRFDVKGGSYVRGFGKAYQLSGNALSVGDLQRA